MIWAVLALYEHPANKKALPTSVIGSILKTPLTGVDRSSAWTLNFTETLEAQAILSCSITLPAISPGVTIRYRNGNILIESPIYRPPSFTVQYFDKPGSGKVVREEKKTVSHAGGGWFYEADEVARCVRDGKLESEIWGHDKSLLLMDVFDEVCHFPSARHGSVFTTLAGPQAGRIPFTRRSRKGVTHWQDLG